MGPSRHSSRRVSHTMLLDSELPYPSQRIFQLQRKPPSSSSTRALSIMTWPASIDRSTSLPQHLLRRFQKTETVMSCSQLNSKVAMPEEPSPVSTNRISRQHLMLKSKYQMIKWHYRTCPRRM